MADRNIEAQLLLQQGYGDEDAAERARAAENGDEAPVDDEGIGAEEGPGLAHDGPQTGVKGVLADYRHHQRSQQQAREEAAGVARAEYAAMAQHGGSPADNAAMTQRRGSQASNSSDDIDALLDGDSGDGDDRVFAEYRARRMAEVDRAAARAGLGVLRRATPEEYVDIVEQRADSGASVLVLLVDGGRASERVEEYVRAEAGRFSHAVFLCVQAHECAFTDSSVVPVVLVYRGGELKHNLVHVVGQFADPAAFGQRDVGRLLDRIIA
ncbi:hypothetical protein GGF46_005389 [Coemansia sp. RSA 552]|nr:hypothetical protein GGF46_005389 [Coemansia sp. RSA 552]